MEKEGGEPTQPCLLCCGVGERMTERHVERERGRDGRGEGWAKRERDGQRERGMEKAKESIHTSNNVQSRTGTMPSHLNGEPWVEGRSDKAISKGEFSQW